MSGQGSQFMTAKQIASDLEISVNTFRRNLPRMIERDGFPTPAPHSLKPVVWRRVAYERWRENLCGTIDDLAAAQPGQAPGTSAHLMNLARSA